VTRQLQPTDALAHKPEDDPGRARPVSHNLPPMDALEHSTMVTMAARILSERRAELGLDDPRVRQLELGFGRSKVELYEAMLAEEVGRPRSTGTEEDKIRDLLVGARTRLAELEAQKGNVQP
jgi:hypothetical protein